MLHEVQGYPNEAKSVLRWINPAGTTFQSISFVGITLEYGVAPDGQRTDPVSTFAVGTVPVYCADPSPKFEMNTNRNPQTEADP
jgi:hypothetical protein